MTGFVTRTFWYDGDAEQYTPKMVVEQRVGDRTRLRCTWRAFRRGIRTRLEWPDGDPARIFDGATVAKFSYFPSDTFFVPGPVVPMVAPRRYSTPHPFDLPPAPTESVWREVAPLAVRRLVVAGREVVEKRWPAGPCAPDEPGLRCLFDPGTGFLIRQSGDGPDADVIEWSDVRPVADLPDELFTWTGAGRSPAEAAELHRRWRSEGGAGASGRTTDGRLMR